LKSKIFKPNPAACAVYREIYSLYAVLHDAFGQAQWRGNLHHVMKKLIDLRNRARE
jgi:L-ribulokinase